MTLLRKSPNINTNSGSIIRNYVVNSSSTSNILASNSGNPYAKGTVFIKNNTDSLLFNYSIMNYNSILKTVIYGMTGKEFDIVINDFASGSNVGIVITNNEATNLQVSLIEEL